MSKIMIFLISVACCSMLAAAPPSAIGTIKSTGDFRVDGSTIRGNSTVFDGSVIETSATRSEVQLAGMQITLLPESRMKAFSEHTVLERGSVLLKNSAKHVMEADALRVAPADKDSIVQIEMASAGVVLVARAGSAEVRNASGVLVANLRTGVALALNAQAGAVGAVRMTGIVTASNGRYYLTDATANVTVDLRGQDFAKYVGKAVEITGSVVPGAASSAGVSEVVHVAEIASKTAGAGAGAGAGGGGSASATTGLSKLAESAIIGGVSVGGALAGLAAAGTFSSDASVSRQ